MAELFSHILLAFGLFTAVGWAVSWLDRRWVVVGMIGSLLPDLNRIDLLLDDYVVAQLLGIPFNWTGIHTVGGVLLLSGAGAVLFATHEQQSRAFGLLAAGGCSHLLVDAVKAWADGSNGAYLYPFSWWRNPTPGWYVSAERWVFVASLLLAVGVWVVDRRDSIQ
ncbi:LexA-binding, inner membrane-associated putative hydrolase [Halovenus aranensis]|uniref:LexA-binding, inner membrane-associated putative hydrolase n=1 Tax=Halovenus aranensis TaxID=890420 RepID=A0A1G8VUZ1_9EURY|nr:metal-dependent hydrolase [Halovenus aranensis]SDJ69898.1 LexA-binding, inner membrane-associated putative hydrolase [Halovenus aranensis]